MIGKIVEIIDSKIHIKLTEGFTGSIIDKYVITMKSDKILVAEVESIENGLAYADLICILLSIISTIFPITKTPSILSILYH